jgi:hypothetical protein
VLEDGEHNGYLTTKSEFFIRRGNLMKKATAATFADQSFCRSIFQ